MILSSNLEIRAFDDIKPQVVRENLEKHRSPELWADVSTIFQHDILPVVQAARQVRHAGDGCEVLQLSAPIVLHDLIAALVIMEEASP